MYDSALEAQWEQQAAKDGWVHLPNVKPGDFITVNGGTVILNGDGTMTKVNRMTGQEWYDRFSKELPPIVVGKIPSGAEMFNICNDAAKKASGIE